MADPWMDDLYVIKLSLHVLTAKRSSPKVAATNGRNCSCNVVRTSSVGRVWRIAAPLDHIWRLRTRLLKDLVSGPTCIVIFGAAWNLIAAAKIRCLATWPSLPSGMQSK